MITYIYSFDNLVIWTTKDKIKELFGMKFLAVDKVLLVNQEKKYYNPTKGL